jgi:uncharacterized protein YegP (UPF0339 family)
MSKRPPKKTGFYKDKTGKHRWRTVSEANGKITGASSEGFERRGDVLQNALLVREGLNTLILSLAKPSTVN